MSDKKAINQTCQKGCFRPELKLERVSLTLHRGLYIRIKTSENVAPHTLEMTPANCWVKLPENTQLFSGKPLDPCVLQWTLYHWSEVSTWSSRHCHMSGLQTDHNELTWPSGSTRETKKEILEMFHWGRLYWWKNCNMNRLKQKLCENNERMDDDNPPAGQLCSHEWKMYNRAYNSSTDWQLELPRAFICPPWQSSKLAC